MPEIPLFGRGEAVRAMVLVDSVDYEALAAMRWGINNNGYAIRRLFVSDRHRVELMHRAIMGLTWGDRHEVDHINHDKLDNRRSNLRVVTRLDNIRNSASRRSSLSSFRAVSWDKEKQRWRARPRYNGRYFHLGYFDDDEVAARAVDSWRLAVDPTIPSDPAFLRIAS